MSLFLKACPSSIIKRDGTKMPFDTYKIRRAIEKAADATQEEGLDQNAIDALVEEVVSVLPEKTPTVEGIQDLVEIALIRHGFSQTAKAYILYRAKRNEQRKETSALMTMFKEISFTDSIDADVKRENANIDGDTAMGTMLKYGSEGSKYFVDHHVLPEEMAKAHAKGKIHIHDKDFYLLTETCCQIPLTQIFQRGFSTGHGYLRSPQSIRAYAALACIAIQANQNEMHGGQSIPDFDYAMAPGVQLSWEKALKETLTQALVQEGMLIDQSEKDMVDAALSISQSGYIYGEKDNEKSLTEKIAPIVGIRGEALAKFVLSIADKKVEKETYQAMEALIHNLNTMNSRAGAQVPFSSLNYGTDTSHAGRLVMRQLLKATEAGLGNGETAIFPVQIFKVKEDVNYNPEDPNYDLFLLAMEVSAKRLFPNFSFLDAPFNAQYYEAGKPETEVAYMGCRTRVMGNVHDKEKEITYGRGNLSFTSVNLPRIALETKKEKEFFAVLKERMALVAGQLLHRFRIQGAKTKKNYPFLMGEGLWMDADTLGDDEPILEILKHGTLTIGFIGLAEALKVLTGHHHGESAESQALGIKIIQAMRDYTDDLSEKTKLNFSLIATPAEGLSGRFVAIDKKEYGIIEGVTDREYYTNSFHVPVYYNISAFEKIKIEAPYHELTNAGHITYVELDGDTALNLPAFQAIIRTMKEAGIGYGSVNHPVDRDSVCGYVGTLHDMCPKCGRKEDDGPKFQRIRRITGYLVGTTDRFNNAKAAEERDRVRHGF